MWGEMCFSGNYALSIVHPAMLSDSDSMGAILQFRKFYN